ncbi:MAG: response regulator transcription factor [Fimbriimonas sp.]
MLEPTTDAPKREEQVLVLAAGGLTDKEIALRLGISPDTVGTYWRRVLAKYQAASRTEVVAKYMEDRAKVSMESLRYVNECLTLFNEHMLEHGGTATLADAILASVCDWILVFDAERRVVFSNRPLPAGSVISDFISSDDGFAALDLAVQGPVEAVWAHDGDEYQFALAPGVGAAAGHVTGCGRVVSSIDTSEPVVQA